MPIPSPFGEKAQHSGDILGCGILIPDYGDAPSITPGMTFSGIVSAVRCSTVFFENRIFSLVQRTLLTIACLFCFIGCNKTLESSPRAPINACALLTSEEIERVQGVPVTEGRGSANANTGFRTSHCYYAARESSKSVSITVTQCNPAHPGKRTAKNVWDHMFSEEGQEEREPEGEREEGEKIIRPVKIDGVGDEAYWTGARFGGALYVLSRQKDTFMRISVGGADSEEKKIEKSKALAGKAFSRL